MRVVTKVFIDGQAGTTGLQISERLAKREDIDLLSISGKHRKDSRNSKSNENTSPTRKKTDAPTKKKSGGVGKFLAGLFGGK